MKSAGLYERCIVQVSGLLWGEGKGVWHLFHSRTGRIPDDLYYQSY